MGELNLNNPDYCTASQTCFLPEKANCIYCAAHIYNINKRKKVLEDEENK